MTRAVKLLGCVVLTLVITGSLIACGRPNQEALPAQEVPPVVSSESRNIIANNPDYQRVCAEMIGLLQQMALMKSDAGIELDDEMLVDKITDLTSRWSMEEIQLYYQIMLQGRQDLKISPDEAAGFEMLMLRLLAFSPESETAVEIAPEKKSL